jgi:hypothetical protein
MNTYYTLNLTQKERDLLLYLAEVGYNEQLTTWEYAPEHPKRLASEALLDTLKNAPQHPNIEDIYMHDAQHSGFKEGETVLLECSIISSADHVSTVAVHHIPATPGEVIMVSNNLIYHKD